LGPPGPKGDKGDPWGGGPVSKLFSFVLSVRNEGIFRVLKETKVIVEMTVFQVKTDCLVKTRRVVSYQYRDLPVPQDHQVLKDSLVFRGFQ